MKKLNYQVLKESGYQGYVLEKAPVKILQFGEGNFLRAFADYWFDVANEKAHWQGKALLIQPIAQGLTERINAQEGLYTLYLRGSEKGEKIDKKRVISLVEACLNPYDNWETVKEAARGEDLEYVISNTTEAGIVYEPSCKPEDAPPASFPAKLTRLLYERFMARKKGLVILSCELIDDNGIELKKCVLRHGKDWGLGEDFAAWLEKENLFCSTLVDRIVPGRIQDPAKRRTLEEANGYEDDLLVVGEVFGVWYIEGPKELEEKLPFQRAGVNVHVVPQTAPYKKRKVRILNGAHTGMVLGAYLAGFHIVRECMEDEVMLGFMNRILQREVIPILPLDKEDCEDFAAAVRDRFSNPFVDHQLLSISLNSTAKWRARNLPSLLEYAEKFKKLPPCLVMGMAAYIAFYSSALLEKTKEGLRAKRPAGEEYLIQDEGWVLDFYWERRDAAPKDLVREVLGNKKMWGQDLNQITGLYGAVLEDLMTIEKEGARAAFAKAWKEK